MRFGVDQDADDNQQELEKALGLPKKKFVMDEFPVMLVGKEAEHVKRTSVSVLSSGKDTTVRLRPSDRITREGWDDEHVFLAQKGDILMNFDGGDLDQSMFEVTEVKRGVVHVRNLKDGYVAHISTTPRDVKAHEYRFRVSDSLNKRSEIKVYDMVFKDRSLKTTEFLFDLVAALPAQHFNSVKEIRIDKEGGRFSSGSGKFRTESSLLVSDGVLTLYLTPELVEEDPIPIGVILGTLYHELGHAIAAAIRGNPHPGPKWTGAMKVDGNELSHYASKTRYKRLYGGLKDQGEIEDFAEAVALYLSSDGARDIRYKKLREACRNRFEFLDDLFDNRVYQEVMNTHSLVRMILGKKIL